MNGNSGGAEVHQSKDYLGLVPMSDTAAVQPSVVSASLVKDIRHQQQHQTAQVAAPAVPIQDDSKSSNGYSSNSSMDAPVVAQLANNGFQLNFLDQSAVETIKNTFASLIDLAHDKTARIAVLNRKTFYTLMLQDAVTPISVRDLNTRLSALPLCISGVEYHQSPLDGSVLLSVDFAKKDQFHAMVQLEGSAKRARSSPLFGTDELEPINGSAGNNKRAKLTSAGQYSMSKTTGYAPRRTKESAGTLEHIRKTALDQAYFDLVFINHNHTADDESRDVKDGGFSTCDSQIMRRVVEYGMSCCGDTTPAGLRWTADKFTVGFTGYERLDLDQMRGFHDLFPHHIEDVQLNLVAGSVTVLCRPYLHPCLKPWSSTLYYTKAA